MSDMPRIRKPLKIDHTRALFRECISKSEKSYSELAPIAGFQVQSLRNKVSKGSDSFTIDFMRKLRRELGISMEDLIKALEEDLK